MEIEFYPIKFNNGRAVYIDKDRNILCEELNIFTIHFKDDYYLALGDGVAHFLKFDRDQAWRWGHYGERGFCWEPASSYKWEWEVFRSQNEVEYSYIDSVRDYVRRSLQDGLGLLSSVYVNVPSEVYVNVPSEVFSDFNNFYIRFKYGGQ